MTVREALSAGKEILERASVEEAALDARLLLEFTAGLTCSDVLIKGAEPLTKEQEEAYRAALSRRAKREPLQHITGSVSFMGIEIRCDGRALIPRQETELLAEQAIRLSEAANKPCMSVLDLCTGTGCIAVALALSGRFTAVTAADVSGEALELAALNIAQNKASVALKQGDLFDAVPGERFDMIVSNPPYISAEEMDQLMPEVRDHDPHLALSGGSDGLDFYRRIAAEAPRHLNPGGRILLEIGAGQGKAVSALLKENGFTEICILQDYSGLDRIVTAAGGNDV